MPKPALIFLLIPLLSACTTEPLVPPVGQSNVFSVIGPEEFHDVLHRHYWQMGILIPEDSEPPYRYISYPFAPRPFLLADYDIEKILNRQYFDLFYEMDFESADYMQQYYLASSDPSGLDRFIELVNELDRRVLDSRQYIVIDREN